MRASILVAVVTTLFTACGANGSGGTNDTDDGDSDVNDTSGALVGDADSFVTCNSAALPQANSPVDWEHTATDILMGFDPDPDHSAQDVLVTDVVTGQIEGKFAYGVVSKDLEDEWVEAWIDDCSGEYVFVGEGRTDSDGRLAIDVPSGLIPDFGRFATFLRVQGDQSFVQSELRRYPEGTELMISDIDGTLTTADTELFQDIFADLFEPLFNSTYVPTARANAVETMTLRHDQGYVLVYLSGRPYYLTDITHEWLDDLAFPEATVHIIDGTAQALPTNDAVGEFKRGYLADLIGMGFVINGAYGNATTDVYGYGNAPVEPNRIWIAGQHGGEGGTVAIGDDYTAHIAVAAAEDDVVQPFVEVP